MTEQQQIDAAVEHLDDAPVTEESTIAQQLADNLSVKISGGVPPTEVRVEDHFAF